MVNIPYTENYNLYVQDVSETALVEDWVAEIAGVTGSNMTKIDAALSGKADTSDVTVATSSEIDGVLQESGFAEQAGGS